MTTVQIQIPDQQAAALKAHAQACGLTVEQWLMQQVEQVGPLSNLSATANHSLTVDPETAREIGSRISAMTDSDVLQRYHKLVDSSLQSDPSAADRFEIEQIDARLDRANADPRIEERDRKWDLERSELLQSIEDLLNKLKK